MDQGLASIPPPILWGGLFWFVWTVLFALMSSDKDSPHMILLMAIASGAVAALVTAVLFFLWA